MAKARTYPHSNDQMEGGRDALHVQTTPLLTQGEEKDLLSHPEQDSVQTPSLSMSASLTCDAGDESLLSRLSKRRKRQAG